MITSYAFVQGIGEKPDEAQQSGVEGVWIRAMPSGHKKCVRCWHHRESVGQDSKHPELCSRCVENVDGEGETRHFA